MAQPQAQMAYELYRSTSYVTWFDHPVDQPLLTRSCCRIGIALADTLDDLISSRRIEPQLAMKIMNNFDESVAKVLGERVKARMQFKVWPKYLGMKRDMYSYHIARAHLIPTASATTFGLS